MLRCYYQVGRTWGIALSPQPYYAAKAEKGFSIMVQLKKSRSKFRPTHVDEHNLYFGYGPIMTDEQKEYMHSLLTKQITFVDAASGTGKTTLAVIAAKLIGKPMYYVFAPVQEGKMGFRPGNQKEKEAEYYPPLADALLEINENPMQVIFDEDNADNQKNGNVWVYPMSHIFARGTNLKNATVIIDEAQNFTKGELKKLLTRIHDSCTVIVIGNADQCDLPNPEKSGFHPYMNHFAKVDYAARHELTVNFRGNLAKHADSFRW